MFALLPMALTQLRVGTGGGGPPAFPAEGLYGSWWARDAVTHGRYHTVPNRAAGRPLTAGDYNLFKHTAHSSLPGTLGWGVNSGTLTGNQVGATGATEGVRLQTSTSSGSFASADQAITGNSADEAYTMVTGVRQVGGTSTIRATVASPSASSTTAITTGAVTQSAVAFTVGGGTTAFGFAPVVANGVGNADVVYDPPRLYWGDVTADLPADLPEVGHLRGGLYLSPVRVPTFNPASPVAATHFTFSGSQFFGESYADAPDLSTGDHTVLHVIRIASDPASIGTLNALRINDSALMSGLRGAGRLCYGDQFRETHCTNGIRLEGQGFRVLITRARSSDDSITWRVDRQQAEKVGGVGGANASSTHRDFNLGAGFNGGQGFAGDWIGSCKWARALSDSEMTQAARAAFAEITAHGHSVPDRLPVAVCFGDSWTAITDGWASYINANSAYRWLVINAGHPGDDYSHLLARESEAFAHLTDLANPFLLYLFFATNNVEQSGKPAAFAAMAQTLIDNALAAGFTHALPITLGPKDPAVIPGYNANMLELNGYLRALLRKAGVIDMAADPDIGEGTDGTNSTYWDGTAHPKPAASAKQGAIAAEDIDTVVSP